MVWSVTFWNTKVTKDFRMLLKLEKVQNKEVIFIVLVFLSTEIFIHESFSPSIMPLLFQRLNFLSYS